MTVNSGAFEPPCPAAAVYRNEMHRIAEPKLPTGRFLAIRILPPCFPFVGEGESIYAATSTEVVSVSPRNGQERLSLIDAAPLTRSFKCLVRSLSPSVALKTIAAQVLPTAPKCRTDIKANIRLARSRHGRPILPIRRRRCLHFQAVLRQPRRRHDPAEGPWPLR